MSVLAIPTAISSAVSQLTSHHGHKKGVHGSGGSSALNNTSSTDDGQPTGSTQSLFGTLLDSVEQVVGIQTPASTTANAASLNASKLSPAAMIAAARSAIQKA
jgi:hypothetical protein